METKKILLKDKMLFFKNNKKTEKKLKVNLEKLQSVLSNQK
jgi:hypothetical protein